jgi:hypothetical protein
MDCELDVGLVNNEKGAGSAHIGIERGDEFGSGEDEPTVGQGRLDHDCGDITASKASPERVRVVVGEGVRGLRRRGIKTGEIALHAAVVAT